MIFGGIAVFCAHLWRHDSDCKSSPRHVLYGSIMYGSYFILFIHFFYVTYLRKKPIPIKVSLTCDHERSSIANLWMIWYLSFLFKIWVIGGAMFVKSS